MSTQARWLGVLLAGCAAAVAGLLGIVTNVATGGRGGLLVWIAVGALLAVAIALAVIDRWTHSGPATDPPATPWPPSGITSNADFGQLHIGAGTSVQIGAAQNVHLGHLPPWATPQQSSGQPVAQSPGQPGRPAAQSSGQPVAQSPAQPAAQPPGQPAGSLPRHRPRIGRRTWIAATLVVLVVGYCAVSFHRLGSGPGASAAQRGTPAEGPGGGSRAEPAQLPAPTLTCPSHDSAAGYVVPDVGNRENLQSEDCYGFIAGQVGVPPFVFGRSPDLTGLERDLLTDNPAQVGGLTVVWFGALSCMRYEDDNRACAGPKLPPYQFEAQELQGFLLVKSWLAKARIAHPELPQIHWVIADAGPAMAHAQEVASRLVARRATLGRTIMIGGGDSRTSVQQAISTLLDADIPVIAPSLAADRAAPAVTPGGSPPEHHDLNAYRALGSFVDRAGYFPFSPQNGEVDDAMIRGLLAQYPNGVDLTVYTAVTDQAGFGDLYITSHIADLLAAAERQGLRPGHPDQHVVEVALATPEQPLTTAVCKRSAGVPSVVAFVDRWGEFRTFARKLTQLCKPATGPRPGVPLVISPGSVSRLFEDTRERALLGSDAKADWSLLYLAGGQQCQALLQVRDDPDTPADDLGRASAGQAATLITLAKTETRPGGRDLISGANCDDQRKGAQIGAHVAPFWDAAQLAIELWHQLQGGADLAHLQGISHLAEGSLTYADGKVTAGGRLLPIQPVCLYDIGKEKAPRLFSTCAAQSPHGLGLDRFIPAMLSPPLHG